MSYIVNTPLVPCYAMIFTALDADCDYARHTELRGKLVDIAGGMEGFIGFELSRNPDGAGVAVVYWMDLDSLMQFVRDLERRAARQKDCDIWYDQYFTRICEVERPYGCAA